MGAWRIRQPGGPWLRATSAALIVAAAVAACGSTEAGSGWTFAPAASTTSPSSTAPASAEPSATSSTEPTPAPSPDASPSPEPSASPSPGPSEPSYSVVRTATCPGTETFECVTLAVPKDHFGSPGNGRWEVTFAIHRATGTRIGTYVEITGGPGYGGIPDSDDYLDYYATEITDAYDMVYLDQRGIGQSGPIQCAEAATIYYQSAARPHVNAERDAALAAARRFASDCVAETGVDIADLPFYATRQAAEDLEAVRDYLGVERMELYGLSYGTQFVQTYAAAHPDRVATLYLDGPVDLAIDAIAYYTEAARSAEDALIETLTDCTVERSCRRDIRGGDALAAYDALAATLSAGPIEFDFPLATGALESRSFTSADLENAAFNAIYYSYDRLLLQRAVASASAGDLVPLARLAYGAIGVDPETLEAVVDPGYSDALYYAVECQDYAFFADVAAPEARVDAWVAAADANAVNGTRLATGFYGDLPCLFWPNATTDPVRPAPITDPPYPVFVLASTTDPATPIANGMRIFARLDDAYFIQAVGGAHVIYGWGEPCPDDLMADWLVRRTLPATRVTTCRWQAVDPYVPVPPVAASGYVDALDLMRTTDDQIFNAYEYINVYDGERLTVGCDFGGTITYAPTDVGTRVILEACEFTRNVALTGRGATDDVAGTFRLQVARRTDTLRYDRDGDGGVTVVGTFRGQAVSLSDPG